MLPTYHVGRVVAMALGLAWAAIATMTAGCGGSGAVEIVFMVPEGEGLSPLGEQIAEVVLVRSEPGLPPERTVRQVVQRGQDVEMGTIPAGYGVRLAVELRSPTQRLLGYGRSLGLDIDAGSTVEVPIFLRRPFVYVTAGTSILAFDATTGSEIPTYRSTIDAVDRPFMTAATPDGAHLITVAHVGPPEQPPEDSTEWSMSRLKTTDHRSLEPESVPLGRLPGDLGISADGRYAVIGHGGDGGGISIVDLDNLAAGTVTFVALGNVTDVALSPAESGADTAFALIDGNRDCENPVASTLVAVSLANRMPVATSIDAQVPVADMAVLSDGALVAALPCTGEVVRWQADGTGRETLAAVDNASVVAVSGQRIWSVGTELPAPGMGSSVGARLVLVSVNTADQQQTRMALPAVEERARSRGFSEPGEETNRQINADAMTAFDLVTLPGEDYIAVLTSGEFEASAQGDVLGVPVLPAITLRNREYMLIDTATGALVQRVRTLCDLDVGPAVIGGWECSLSPGQDETASELEPHSIAALYGAR